MIRWKLFIAATFFLGSETSSLIDTAIKGQSLTDRGVSIGLIMLLSTLFVWFAKVQFSKEEKLTNQLSQLLKESTEAHKANTARLEVLTEEIKRLDRYLEQEREIRRSA